MASPIAGEVGRRSGFQVLGDLFEILVGVDAAGVFVAKGEADGIVADELPIHDGYARELLAGVATVPAAKDVRLADIGGAGRGRAEDFSGNIVFGAICPADGQLVTDYL